MTFSRAGISTRLSREWESASAGGEAIPSGSDLDDYDNWEWIRKGEWGTEGVG